MLNTTLKNILISAYTCCPNRGSEPGNGWNWIKGYAANGYTVHCVTASKYMQQITDFCQENNVKNLHFYFTDSRYSLALLKIPLIGIYLHYFSWLILGRKIINNLIRQNSFSLAHHITYSNIKYGTPLYNLDFKVILGPLGGNKLPHKSLKKYLGRHIYFEIFKKSMSNFLAKINPTVARSVKSAECILVSNEIATSIIKQYTTLKPVQMFDAGLPDYFKSRHIERKLDAVINILWIGRILPIKGLNLALESLTHLPKNVNFHFYILGDGVLLNRIKVLTKKYALENRTTFLGRLAHHELGSVFEKSHLFLFPSLMDSCPMQVFEAMAYGLPVVTLDHQGMKEQVTDGTGVKIAVTDSTNYPQELAKGISQIIQNQETYNSYSLNAWNFGQKQLWETRIKKFIESL